jgi:hypothetical protein
MPCRHTEWVEVNFYPCLPSGLDSVGSHYHAPAALPMGKETWYELYRSLGEPHRCSGWVWKILALPKFERWIKKRYIYKDFRLIRPVTCKDFWVLKADVCTKYEIPSWKRIKQNTNSGLWHSQRSRWKTDWSKFINSFKSSFLTIRGSGQLHWHGLSWHKCWKMFVKRHHSNNHRSMSHIHWQTF